MENIKILELLGEGGFGQVFRAYDKITGKLLAVKYFKDPDFEEIRDEDYLMSEVEAINDKNQFIKFHGLFKDSSDKNNGQPDKYILIMESGDINLEEVLKMRKKYEIPQIMYIFQSLVNDFLHLQLNGIATRDVKTQNIILIQNEKDSNKYNYKISDFGIGCVLKKEETEIKNGNLAGRSYQYAAPEVKLIYQKIEDGEDIIIVNGKETYDPFKGDVYSLGITILDLFGLSRNEFFKIIKNKTTDNINNKNPQEIIFDLIEKMLKDDPTERINFGDIKKKLNEIIKDRDKQPLDELLYIKQHIEFKNKEKDYVTKISEYLKLSNNYYDIGVYKIANDFLNICYYDIYLKNVDKDLTLKNNEIEAAMFSQLGRYSMDIIQDYVKAEEFYVKSLTIRENVLGFNHQDTAMSYNNLAVFHQTIKHDFVKAEEYYIKSLKIRENILGLNHQDTATSYNNLAVFYEYIKQDYVMAEKYYVKSLNIRENVFGLNHQDTATSYNNLAVFYEYIKQDYVIAEIYYIKSLTIRESVLGLNHQETAKSYNNLATFYHIIKHDYVKAEEYYLKSLNIKEKVIGLNHQDTAQSYNNLAKFYEDIKQDYVKAEEYYIKSLNIFKEVLGKNHEKTITIYENLFNFYEQSMKDHATASKFKALLN